MDKAKEEITEEVTEEVTEEIPESHKYRRYRVQITVESAKGYCTAGHKAGDSWICDGQFTPPGMCLAAFYVCYLGIRNLSLGGASRGRTP